jgi:hypothetical protein
MRITGYVKIMADPKRGRILGAEIVGKDAGELIHAFSGPLAMQATVFDLLRAPWYHPTLAEIITYPLEEIAEKVTTKRRQGSAGAKTPSSRRRRRDLVRPLAPGRSRGRSRSSTRFS